MNRIFNMDNGVFRVLGKLVDCIWLSILFIFSCIPIFTIGPALTALYYTVQKVLKNDRGYVGAEYWKSFRCNFKQGTIIWLIMLAVGLLLYGDVQILKYLDQEGNSLGKTYIFFQIMLVFEVIWGVYVYPYMSRFENTKKNILKNAGFMAILHLPKTLLLAVITIVFGLIVYIIPIAILIAPALYAWLINPILESIFQKYMSEEDRIIEEEMNREFKN